MAMLFKLRARKPRDGGPVAFGYYPHGMGGMNTNAPCIGLFVGSHKLVMTTDEFRQSLQYLKQMDAALYSAVVP